MKKQISSMFLLLCMLVLAQRAGAQNSTASIAINGNANWQLIKSTAQYNIYSKESDCIDAANGINTKNVLLKVENLTNQTLNLGWNNTLYYNNNCTTCNSVNGENHMSVSLSAAETQEGVCGNGTKALSIYVKMLDMESESLTSFSLNNITTN